MFFLRIDKYSTEILTYIYWKRKKFTRQTHNNFFSYEIIMDAKSPTYTLNIHTNSRHVIVNVYERI